MGLLCNEGADAQSSYWKSMARYDPAGTILMKAPEVRMSLSTFNVQAVYAYPGVYFIVILQN